MTTIAYRAGCFAADTQCTNGDGSMLRVRKLTRLEDGSVFAGAGDYFAVLALKEWAATGFEGKRPTKTAEAECLLLKADRTLWVLGSGGKPFEIVDEFTAIGSGSNYAIGAMAFGATALQAVKIAAKHCVATSGPFDVMRVP